VRLYEELNIIVNVQHIHCQKCAPVCQLRMLLTLQIITNVVAGHISFFSKIKIFGNVIDHQTMDQGVC